MDFHRYVANMQLFAWQRSSELREFYREKIRFDGPGVLLFAEGRVTFLPARDIRYELHASYEDPVSRATRDDTHAWLVFAAPERATRKSALYRWTPENKFELVVGPKEHV